MKGSYPMHICPRCGGQFTGKQMLEHGQPLWRVYRVCPVCKLNIVIDKKSKNRQIVVFILAVVALILILSGTLIGKLISMGIVIIAFLYIFYSEKKVKFLPYYKSDQKEGSEKGDRTLK
jgi:hypothetical protein